MIRRLIYRRAQFPNPPYLQSLLNSILLDRSIVKKRLESLAESPDVPQVHRFINTVRRQNNMLFGTLVLYEDDAEHQVLSLDLDKDELIITPKPLDSSKDRFLEAILHFGIYENHVVLLQSMGLRARNLENHLTWLLAGSDLLGNGHVNLLAEMPVDKKQKIKNNSVKMLRVGSPIGESGSRKKSMELEKGVVQHLLHFLMDENGISTLDYDAIQNSRNLMAWVELRYSNRDADKDAQKAINQITNGLRHLEQEDCQIVLGNGLKMQGSDFRIEKEFAINENKGSIDKEDLWVTMENWLASLSSNNIISGL